MERQSQSKYIGFLGQLGICLSTALCLLSLPVAALAADMSITPSIKLQETYDDNVTFARTDEQDDFVTSINPEVTLSYATELVHLETEAAVDVLRYQDDSDLDTENYHLKLDGAYRMTDRYTLSGEFAFLKDTTLDSELEETGLVNRREDRERYTAGGGLSYQLSERSNVGMEYTHTETEYDAPGQVDYDSDSVVLSYNRTFNDQRDVFTIQPYVTYRDSDTSKADNYGLSFGLAHGFSQTLHLTAFLGARYTRTEQVVPWWVSEDEKADENNWGGVADVRLTKTGEILSGTIGYSRDIYFDAQGEPIETDRIHLTADREITRRLRVGFSGSLYFTESEGEFQFEDSRHFELNPSLNYRLTERHWLRMAYSYAHHYDKTAPDNEKYDRHRVWVLLDFRFPKDWSR
jgi:hypothetical protein